MATIQTPLTTAEEFFRMPRGDRPVELVRGIVVMMNMPAFRHGKICGRIMRLLGNFVEEHNLGHVLSNDSGVVTKRDPDSVRGADVAYYSFERLPKNAEPEVYSNVSPDLVFEVLSPGNRWSEMLVKIGEYLEAGVNAVCVADSNDESVEVFRAERAPQKFSDEDEFSVPDVLAGWKLPVSRFFDD